MPFYCCFERKNNEREKKDINNYDPSNCHGLISSLSSSPQVNQTCPKSYYVLHVLSPTSKNLTTRDRVLTFGLNGVRLSVFAIFPFRLDSQVLEVGEKHARITGLVLDRADHRLAQKFGPCRAKRGLKQRGQSVAWRNETRE